MLTIPCVTIDENNVSVFKAKTFNSEERKGMFLSQRIDANNFRIRQSEPGYNTDWHVAGDATLIAVQKGCIKITLQNNEFKEFRSGDIFIAADYLENEVEFDSTLHGHKAEVIGEEPLIAVHIKLGGFTL